MEKETRGTGASVVRIAITGPESTGKSTLARQLAAYFDTLFVPEYARIYVEQLDREYTYADVEHIARTQVRQLAAFTARAHQILFLDTYLIITKVWFDVVYHRHPAWVDEEIARHDIDLYLLCRTDIPWEYDPVRENGGERREALYEQYRKELEWNGCRYEVVEGLGEDRLQHALEHVRNFLKNYSHGRTKI